MVVKRIVSFIKKRIKKSRLLFFFIILTILIKLPSITPLSYSDDFFYMANGIWVANNNFNPLIGGDFVKQEGIYREHPSHETLSQRDELFIDSMHPPFFYLALGLLYKLFGPSVIVHRLLILILAGINLFFIYKISNHLYNKRTGIIASAIVLFLPAYFAQTGLLNLVIPTSALLSATIYYLIKDEDFPFLISSSLLLLINEAVIPLYFLVLLYRLYTKNNTLNPFKNLKHNLIYLIPPIVSLSWIFSHYLIFGWIFFVRESMILDISSVLTNIYNFSREFLYANYTWIFLIIFILITLKFSTFKKLNKYSFLIIAGSISLLYCIINRWIDNELFFYFAILFYFLGFMGKLIRLNKDKTREFVLFVFLLSLMQLFIYAIMDELTLRYFIPVIVFIFIIWANFLDKLFKKYSLIATIIIIALFISQYYIPHEIKYEYKENNLEYLKIVEIYKEAADYLNTNYPNSTILVYNMAYFHLKYPYLGHSKNHLDIINHKESQSQNFDLAYISDLDSNIDNPFYYKNHLFDESNFALIKTFPYNVMINNKEIERSIKIYRTT